MQRLKREPQLAQQAARQIRAYILNEAEPGARLPTVRQLAATLGISVPTVRAAEALLAQDGLLTIRHGSGVFVAERQDRKRIGILSELNLLDPRIGPFFRALADAVKSQLSAKGYEPALYVGDAQPGPDASDEPTCPQFWADAATGRLDGAIILNVPGGNAWGARIRSCPIPAVGPWTGFQAEIDFTGIATAAVRRLLQEGCRRIGLICWHLDGPFRRALAACGLEPDAAWIRSDLDPALPGAGWEEFREIWLASDEKPDALVILDDMLFADAQLAMFELGVRVPHDLRLAIQTTRGAAGSIRLPVTAYEIDPAEAAAASVALLLERLAGRVPDPPNPVIPFAERLVTPVGPGTRPAPRSVTVPGRTIAARVGP